MSGIQYKRDKRSPIPKNERVSKTMSRIKSKNTKPEIILRKAIYAAGIRGYRLNFQGLPGKPDILVKKKKLVIFIHGCFWHGCQICGRRIPKHNSNYWLTKINKNITRDRIKKLNLEVMGYKVLTVWEHEIKNTLHEVIKKIISPYEKQH